MLACLNEQTFRDFVWIIVNDGEESAAVDHLVHQSRETLAEVIYLPGTGQSQGMEHATNRGVAVVKTPLIVLLDDDDTWEPEFLERTVAFLGAHPNYVGVCTQTHIVNETGMPPVTVDKFVMNSDLQSIQIADMTIFNHLTTNSLVYRTSVHAEIGLYREDMPVMGDWDFGLRLISRHEIGVIPVPLANYHRRVDVIDALDPAANSVVARQSIHAEMDAALRNRLLRAEIESNRPGLGWLLAFSRIRVRSGAMERFRFHELETLVRRYGEAAQSEKMALQTAISDSLRSSEALTTREIAAIRAMVESSSNAAEANLSRLLEAVEGVARRLETIEAQMKPKPSLLHRFTSWFARS